MKKKYLTVLISLSVLLSLALIIYISLNNDRLENNVFDRNYNSIQIKDYKIINAKKDISDATYKNTENNCIIVFSNDSYDISPKDKICPSKGKCSVIKKVAMFKHENRNVFIYTLDVGGLTDNLNITNLCKKSASIYDEIINESSSYTANNKDFAYNLVGSFILLTPLQNEWVFRAYIVYSKKDNGTTKFYYLRKDFSLISSSYFINNDLIEYGSKFTKYGNGYQTDLISPFPDKSMTTNRIKYQILRNKSWDIKFHDNYKVLQLLDIENDNVLWNVTCQKGLFLKKYKPLKEFCWSQLINVESNIKNKVTGIKEYEELIFNKNICNKNNTLNLNFDIQIED